MNDKIESINQFLKLRSAFADQCEDVIYHYTSSDGLMGILENSEIWLTNTAFVNDTTECKALNNEPRLFNNGSITNKHVMYSWQNFQHHLDGNDTYIASFSIGEESLLEQLRSYGNFRIGFDAKKLLRNPFNLYKCVYSKEEIAKWISEKSNLKEWEADLLDDNLKRAAAFNLIYAASRKYKNKHFKNENEVRLIAHSHHSWGLFTNSPSMYENDPPIHYRNQPGYNFPVPYVKFTLAEKSAPSDTQKKPSPENRMEMMRRKLIEERRLPRKLLPITEVLVGPMLHQKEAKLACEILLSDKGYANVKVENRDIPYRGF
jgi:hypothetical protein